MKQIMLLTGFLMFCLFSMAQGKYAGAQSKLIGTKYADSRNIPGLKGWEFRQGSLVTGIDEQEAITVDVWKKGKVWITFFSIKEDTADKEFTIIDVIEIKTLLPGYIIGTGLCRMNGESDPTIVATVKWVPEKEILKPVKQAWKLDRDKLRILAIPVKNVDCISEGGD
jgi:hypothetical protein